MSFFSSIFRTIIVLLGTVTSSFSVVSISLLSKKELESFKLLSPYNSFLGNNETLFVPNALLRIILALFPGISSHNLVLQNLLDFKISNENEFKYEYYIISHKTDSKIWENKIKSDFGPLSHFNIFFIIISLGRPG